MNTKTEYSLQEAFETLMLYFPYNATLGCLVILLNSFIFYFYHKQYRKFVPCMYLLLALLDCLMIIFMIIFYCLVFKLQCESSDPMLEHKWVIIGFKMGENGHCECRYSSTHYSQLPALSKQLDLSPRSR